MKKFNYFDFLEVISEDEVKEIQNNLIQMSGKELENHYMAILRKGTCENKNKKIGNLDFLSYYIELRTQWNYFLMNHMNENVKALYFEFDMLFRWTGLFATCNKYKTMEKQDDDWALDGIIDQWDSGDFELLSIVYNGCCNKCTGSSNNKKVLVALTIALFKQVVEKNNPNVPVCIHYRYQDPLFRLFSDKIYE